jgi:RimJ/RimL family protein N-acetyltransferase
LLFAHNQLFPDDPYSPEEGIALALKLRTIAYAQEHGKPYIKTWNDSPNEGMIALNERLGFVRHTGWFTYRKMFSS